MENAGARLLGLLINKSALKSILGNFMRIVINTGRCGAWLPLLAVCVMSGCTSLPDKQKGIWPWEYGRGKGEPDTGDYFAFRAGVANFGEPPQAVKPITAESTAPHTPEASSASATAVTKTAPPAESKKESDKITSTTRKIYDFKVEENKSASASLLLLDTVRPNYDITAFNPGNAPVSVAIDIDHSSSQNAATDKTLPHYAVVPAKTDRNLVHFSPRRKDEAFKFRYNYAWSIGDYTASHNCREQYRFPFGAKVRAFASVTDATHATPYTRYAVIFSLPKGTPVLAARKGTVIQISSDDKIDILHEDATIGTYSHLGKVVENIVVGKTVTTEDILGSAGTAENNKDAYMQLTVWRPEPVPNDALQANSQQIGFVAVSFPLAFSSTDSDKGKVLTQSQPVSARTAPTR
jgi:murein DD-endopeptidase MepM/ murein hydrolase activator NlpD